MKVLIYLITVIMLVGAMPEERPRAYCGRALAEARIWYCFGPEMATYAKRSFHGAKTLLPAKKPVWPWMSNRVPKRDYGLVDECCQRPCYIHQLLAYC